MSKVNLSGIIKDTRKAFVKHSPEILTGVGIAGMITTTVLAVRATPKAMMLIDKKEYEEQRELTKLDGQGGMETGRTGGYYWYALYCMSDRREFCEFETECSTGCRLYTV